MRVGREQRSWNLGFSDGAALAWPQRSPIAIKYYEGGPPRRSQPALCLPLLRLEGGHGDTAPAAALLFIGNLSGIFKNF